MKTTGVRRSLAAAVGLGVVGALALAPAPASAHDTMAYVYNNAGVAVGEGYIFISHTLFRVCDIKADNVGVYGRMKLRNGTIKDIPDLDGAGGSCGQGTTSYENYIVSYEVVWRGGKSSGWRTA
ncbi:hypothetical protein [Micromonospora sp. NPDC005174]|uniref:hypothetical protein n=1 Tax=unclassified Micromonospora TaxID=2617518 RepID=UPI00339FF0D7